MVKAVANKINLFISKILFLPQENSLSSWVYMLSFLHMFEKVFYKNISNVSNLGGTVLDPEGGCVACSQSCCRFTIWRSKLHTHALHPNPGSPNMGFCVLGGYQQQRPQTLSGVKRMKEATFWPVLLMLSFYQPPQTSNKQVRGTAEPCAILSARWVGPKYWKASSLLCYLSKVLTSQNFLTPLPLLQGDEELIFPIYTPQLMSWIGFPQNRL